MKRPFLQAHKAHVIFLKRHNFLSVNKIHEHHENCEIQPQTFIRSRKIDFQPSRAMRFLTLSLMSDPHFPPSTATIAIYPPMSYRPSH